MIRRLAILACLLVACAWSPMEPNPAVLALYRKQQTTTPWYLSGGVSAANCVAAYAGKGAASESASRSNLSNPGTYTLTPSATPPSWASGTGWKMNGSSTYYNTGLVPDLTVSTWSIIAKFNGGSSTGVRAVVGCGNSGYNQMFVIARSNSGGNRYYTKNNKERYQSGASTNGVLAQAGLACYYNGSLDYTFSALTTGAVTESLSIGAWHIGAGYYYNDDGYITSVAIYNTTLTQAQVQSIGAAMP